jgi:molecular chaperone GrpE
MAEEKTQKETENKNGRPVDDSAQANEKSSQEYHEESHDADEDHVSGMNKKSKKNKYTEKIEELGNKLSEINDKHLRLQAEFDNFRKRTLKEKAELIKSGGESVLTNILPIIDDFDRALGTMSGVADEDPAKIGFLLIFNKFKDFLKINQVSEIEAIGQDFNVDMHDAITKIPAPAEDLKGKVVDVVQKGYLLNGKVIRYAKVVIGD